MNPIERFLHYAAEFEKSFADDDWSRLEALFDEDAVYRVESDLFGCELRGPATILAGMKKSLDGFDRRFATRAIAVSEGPSLDGADAMRVAWTVTYTDEGVPPFVLRGRSLARFRDGRIVELVDSYEPEMDAEARAWIERTGREIDPRYA